MPLVNPLDRIPTQAGQGRHILDRTDMAQVNDEPFQRATVMLLGIGKGQAGLFDGPTAFTLQTRNPNDQFDLARTHGQQLETTALVPESNDVTGLTVNTLQFVGMKATVKHCLTPNKTALWY